MEIINEFHQMIALNKALNYIRFKSTDSDTSELFFSNTIVEMHLQLIEKLREEYKKKGFEIPLDFGYIEEEQDLFNIIITRIRNLTTWSTFDDKTKKEIILLIIKPYSIKENSLQYLMDYK